MRNDFQQGYLHNIVPHEMAIEVSSQGNKALSALKAQAIAARTFAYYNTFDPQNPEVTKRIDNSATKQVYIPFRYDALSSAQQQRVDEAVAGEHYMTLPGEMLPIQAHYGADNAAWTTEGAASYLKSIYDPINAAYGYDVGTDWGGMSSRGASRWGFGHTSSRGPVGPDDPNYPHDDNGDGDFWSARYDHAVQILTHYYTGVHLRDANDAVVTPVYRWLPLAVDWGDGASAPPEAMLPGERYDVTLMLQNAGSVDWGDNVQLVYYWLRGADQVGAPEALDVENLVQGAASATIYIEVQVPAAFRVGDQARLVFDLRNTDDAPGLYFGNREAQQGRPWFALPYDVCIGGECRLYLPLALKNHYTCPSGGELIQNGDFEQGASVWVEQAPRSIIHSDLPVPAYGGAWAAWLGGYDSAADTLYQEFTVPPGAVAAALHFYVIMETEEHLPADYDHFFARLRDSDDQLIVELFDLHNTDDEYVWFHANIRVLGFETLVGQAVRLSFEATTDSSQITSFVLDDVSLMVYCDAGDIEPSEGVDITVQDVERVDPKIGPIPTKFAPSLPETNP